VSQKVSNVAVATEQQYSISQSLVKPDIAHQLSGFTNDAFNNCDNANATSQKIKHKVID
jgi:methyl-accepting chemotaxis protein